MKSIPCAFALALLSAPTIAQTSARVQVKPVAAATLNSFGQDIRFPEGPGQVSVSEYDIPPGAELPVHKHTAPRIGYVMDGVLKVEDVETGVAHTFGKGQVILESVDHWHKGSNPGTDPLTLLVIDLQPKGAGNSTVLKPNP